MINLLYLYFSVEEQTAILKMTIYFLTTFVQFRSLSFLFNGLNMNESTSIIVDNQTLK